VAAAAVAGAAAAELTVDNHQQALMACERLCHKVLDILQALGRPDELVSDACAVAVVLPEDR
jgi:hypothetical protein